MQHKCFVRVWSFWLSLWLAFSPGAAAFQVEPPLSADPGFSPISDLNFSSQWVVLVPDIFDRDSAWQNLRSRLIAGGILPANIINLSTASGFSPRMGLAQQAEVLEQLAETGRAQRGNLKAHIIARGSGALVSRWLQMQRGENSPIQAVLSWEEPGRGLGWAQAAYLLHIPLPRVGMHAPSMRDLSPGSQFLQRLHAPDAQARAWLRASQALQKEILEALQGTFRVKLDQQLRELDQAKQELGQKAQVWARYPESVPLNLRDAEQVKRLSGEASALEHVSAIFSNQEAGEVSAGQLEEALARLQHAGARRFPSVRAPQSGKAEPVSKAMKRVSALNRILTQAEAQLSLQIKAPQLYPVLNVPVSLRKPGQISPGLVCSQAEDLYAPVFLQSTENALEKARAELKFSEIQAATWPTPGQVVLSAQTLDALQVTVARAFTAALNATAGLHVVDAQRQVRKFGVVSAGNRAQGLAKRVRVWENTLALQQAWETLETSRRSWLQSSEDWKRESTREFDDNISTRSINFAKSQPRDLESTYEKYVSAKQGFYPFLSALEKTPEEFPGLKLELENIRIYFGRCDEVEPKVMEAAGNPEAFAEALGCLEGGGAALEREMFAQTLTKQLDQEIGRQEHEARHPEIPKTASGKLDTDTRRVLVQRGVGKELTRWLEQERAHQELARRGWEGLRQRQALERRQYRLEQLANTLAGARRAQARTQAAESHIAQIQQTFEDLAKQGEVEQKEKKRVVNTTAGAERAALLQTLLFQSAQRREHIERLCTQMQLWAKLQGEFDWYAFAGKVAALQLPALQVAAVGPITLPSNALRGDMWVYARTRDREAEKLKIKITRLQALQQYLCQRQASADNVIAGLLDAQAQVQAQRINRDLRSLAAQVRTLNLQARNLAQMENGARGCADIQAQLQTLTQAAGSMQSLAAASPVLKQALDQSQAAAAKAAATWRASRAQSLGQARHNYAAALAGVNTTAAPGRHTRPWSNNPAD